MARRVTRCFIGVQDDSENPYEGNSFQASIWEQSSHTCRGAYGQSQGDDVSR